MSVVPPPLRLGIIGCGEVTQLAHLPSLAQLSALFRVTALCDVSAQVRSALGVAWSVPNLFADASELARSDGLDAVLVANPDPYHCATVLAALTAGKHVLVEKPMCVTLREAREIAAAARSGGLTVQVGYMRRYAPAFLDACSLIPSMGPIRLARVHDVAGFNPLFIEPTSRVIRGDDVAPGWADASRLAHEALITEAIGETAPEIRKAYRFLLGLGTHDLSAMRELLGRPKRVLYAAQRNGGIAISAAFDYGDFVAHYETGFNHIARFDACLEVYGDRQIARVQYNTPYVRNLPTRIFVTHATPGGGVSEQADHPGWGDSFVAQWRAFHASVQRRESAKTSPEDFCEDLELIAELIAAMS